METDITRIANVIRTQDILRRHDFHIKKSFGQNFLTDANILQKIVDAAGLTGDENVVEIGPGLGALTQYLLENSRQVMAFEIDTKLIPILEEVLEPYDNLILTQGDVLKLDLTQEFAKFDKPELPIKVVANLPYYITTPILMHLIESRLPINQMVVMMQREVADRISAVPGTKAYGSLSIAVQYYMTAEVAFNVPRTVFVPAPNVDSAILSLARRENPLVAVADEDWFFKVVKLCFVHRRKTLMNNLTAAFGKDLKDEIALKLDAIGISPTVRAETLTIQEFAALSDGLQDFK